MIDDVTFWSKLDSVYMVSLLDYAPTRRKGAVSIAFVFPSVRPSVCPSVVAYILNNSRTWMPIVSKFGMTVPHLRCDLHTSFKVKRSKGKVILMLTHIVRHIFRTARPTNFNLGIRTEDNDPHQPQAPRPPRSKIKVASSRDQFEPYWPSAISVSLEAGGGIYRVGQTRQPYFVLILFHRRTIFKMLALEQWRDLI